MTMIRNWGFAAGLAAALALVGTAEAQSAGTASDTKSDPAYGSSPAAGSTGSTAGQTATKVDKDLKEKIQKIHASNKAEIHMAQIGAERAQSPEVKQFAETLQRDHQQLDERLTTAAQAAGVELTGKDYDKQHERAMKDMGKLEKKTGQEFDREFMSHMVKDHEKDLKDVKSAARDAEKGNHTELAAVLNQAETGMQGHKTQAEQIRDSLGKGGTASRGGMGSTGADAGSTGSQDTPTGGAEGTSSERVGERGGDTGQSRGGAMGSTGAEAGSTGAQGSTGTQDTPGGGAEGTSSDRAGERGGDTGQSRGDADKAGESKYK